MSTLRRIAERMERNDKLRGVTHSREGYYIEHARPVAKALSNFEENSRLRHDPTRLYSTRRRIPFKLDTKEQRELAKREKAFHNLELNKKREENRQKQLKENEIKKAAHAAKKRVNKDVDDLADIFGKNLGFKGGRTRRHRRARKTRRSTRA
jgi:hypothetical protein